MDTYFELLHLCQKLLHGFGIGSLATITAVAFQDTELSVSFLLSLLLRLILRKSDTSEVNLQDQQSVKATKAFSAQN